MYVTNKLKKIITYIIAFASINAGFSQEIEALKVSDTVYKKVKQNIEFHFLEDSIDTATLTFIATVKASGKNQNIAGRH